MVFVTHLYDLAHGFYAAEPGSAWIHRFARAERQPGGRRTYRLGEAAPLPTSFGEDSYRRIFGLGSRIATRSATTGRTP